MTVFVVSALSPTAMIGISEVKIFEMRVEHPEKRFDVICRLGNFESVRCNCLVRRGGIRPVADR